MTNIKIIKQLVGSNFHQLVLVLWPPLGEDNEYDIDISIAFKFSEIEGQYTNFCIDTNDNWALQTKKLEVRKIISGLLFNERIRQWMNSEINDDIGYEFFDVTEDKKFEEIVGKKYWILRFFYGR